MKTVFNNSEVAHTWSTQSQDSGRNSSDSFYFTGDTIYSYGSHFPIAKIFKGSSDGSGIVLFTNQSYSSTTAQHVSLVYRAVNYKNCIEVANIAPRNTADHRANVKAMLDLISDHVNCWKAARSYKAHWVSQIAKVFNQIKQYLKHFKLTPLKATQTLLDIYAPVANVSFSGLGQERCDLVNDQEWSELQNTMCGTLLGWSVEKIMKQTAKDIVKTTRAKIKKEKQERKELEAAKIRLSGWVNGSEYIPTYGLYRLPVALRIHSELIQTSHGASISFKGFRVAYKTWKRGEMIPGSGISIYSYRTETTDYVQIGCHKIPKSEIEKINSLLQEEILVTV